MTCKDFNEWPDKDVVDCGVCKHLVLTEKFSTCDDYCQSFGQVCWYAAEDENGNDVQMHGGVDGCQITAEYKCSDDIKAANLGSSDMICGCRDGSLSIVL